MGDVAKNTAGAYEQWETYEGVVVKDYYNAYRLQHPQGDVALDGRLAEAAGGVGARVRYTTHRTIVKLDETRS